MLVEEDANITDAEVDAEVDESEEDDSNTSDSDSDSDNSNDDGDGDGDDEGKPTIGRDTSPDSPGFGKVAGVIYGRGNERSLVFDGNYLADIFKADYNNNPEQYPNETPESLARRLEPLRTGKTQATVPTSLDKETGKWKFAWENIRYAPATRNSRPDAGNVFGLGRDQDSSDGSSLTNQGTSRNPTIDYKAGPLSPDYPSDTPAVEQGSGGESLLPKPGNSPIERPDKSDGEDRGLPGPGTTSRPNTTPDQVRQNLIDDAKRWSKSFVKDLQNATAKNNSAADGLGQGISDALNRHNEAVSGLNGKMKISEGTGAPPASPPPDLPPPRPSPEPPLKTPPATPQRKAVQDAINYRNYVQQKVAADGGASQGTRQALVDLGDLGLDIADESYSDGNLPDGDQALETALGALDTVLDFVPGVSVAKDIISLTTGNNPITGEPISDFEKAVIAAGLFAPSFVSGIGKKAIRAASSLKKVVTRGRKSAKKAGEIYDAIENGTVKDFLKGFDNWKDSTAKHIFNGDITVDNQGRFRINGGLHTVEALKRFLGARPDINPVSRETLSNGVERVKLPMGTTDNPADPGAFNKNGRDLSKRAAKNGAIPEPGCKTLFPESWDAQKIVDAINKTFMPGNRVRVSDDGREFFRAKVDGVTIEITVREGKIETAYPTWNQ